MIAYGVGNYVSSIIHVTISTIPREILLAKFYNPNHAKEQWFQNSVCMGLTYVIKILYGRPAGMGKEKFISNELK